MNKGTGIILLISVTALLSLSSASLDAEIRKIEAEDLIGKETLNFYLASYDGRCIHYGEEYYGKYALIMTFFPAAFTPV
jgi:hypothetical protein